MGTVAHLTVVEELRGCTEGECLVVEFDGFEFVTHHDDLPTNAHRPMRSTVHLRAGHNFVGVG